MKIALRKDTAGISRLVNDNSLLQAEVMRLCTRLLKKGKSGVRPEDAHVQAESLLSRAQEMADRYVAEAKGYSQVAEDARLRRDEVMREAKVRAGMILEQARDSATEAAEAARDRRSQGTEEKRLHRILVTGADSNTTSRRVVNAGGGVRTDTIDGVCRYRINGTK